MQLAPILVTVYDRLEHFKSCINALSKNDLAKKSILYVASDGPLFPEQNGRIHTIRKYIEEIKGFKEVIPIIRESNVGAHNNAIYAFNNIINRHNKIIFVEDDTITSFNFLTYMNTALNYYENDYRILTITGYMPPFEIPFYVTCNTWLSKRHCNWGFATWKKKWEKVDISEWDRYSKLAMIPNGIKSFNKEGEDMSEMLKNDSEGRYSAFDLRICYHMFIYNQFCLYPRISKTTNIGFDGTGLHCGVSDYYFSKLDEAKDMVRFDRLMLCSFIMRYLYKCFIDQRCNHYFVLLSYEKGKKILKNYLKRIWR